MVIPRVALSKREQRRLSGYVLLEKSFDRRHIAAILEISQGTVSVWERRFAESLNVSDAPRSGRRRVYGKDVENRFIAFYCQTAPLEKCGQGRWSLRIAANKLQIDTNPVGVSLSRSTMQRMLSRHTLKPHLVKYFLQITDPDFFPKMEHLIALYSSQIKNLYCFDECPGIQVLQRLAPDVCPDDEGAASRWLSEFEYIRNGTIDVFAFLQVRTGVVDVECRGDHTKKTFISVFRNHISQLPDDEDIHYIMDNLCSHYSYDFCMVVAKLSGIKCPEKSELDSGEKRRKWLGNDDRRIIIHFTPFHGSWLNMVEIWFRIMGRMCLRNSYTSPGQLRDAILEFAELWSRELAHPFNWNYKGIGLHQKAVKRFTAMLKYSAGEMTLQLMSKESLLMVNLMNDYWSEIELKYWVELFDTISQFTEQLYENISKSSQPKVKKKAEVAFALLLKTIGQKMKKAKLTAC